MTLVVGGISASLAINLPFAAAVLAELIGVPFAWLRLRRTDAWENRPQGVRRIDLLATFIAKITGLVGLLAALVAVSGLIVSGL